ncbi:hypothetical protein IAU59_005239 [Kwoniella sp. CBS 9459]
MSVRAPSNVIRPFSRQILESIRTKLVQTTPPMSSSPAHTIDLSDPTTRIPKESAVLIPLVNLGGEAHVLMEVRDKGMWVHAGEASFPGGKCDPTDPNFIYTALRETQEELALPPENVEILGRLEPEYSLGNRARVWPFVGFIHSRPVSSLSKPSAISVQQQMIASETDKSLPSISVSSLIPSPAEVSAILPIPLSVLQQPSRLSTHYFRLDTSKPYHKIKCEDFVLPSPLPEPTTGRSSGTVPNALSDEYKGLEVWGLSGWFLNKLAERIGWCKMPPKGVMPED